jgi:ribosomal-protein-alanine N-acetyltransferase
MTSEFKVLSGSKVVLRPFAATDITAEYIGWLNDPEVVKYSNQRFVRHTPESCLRYFHSFAGNANMFISVRMIVDDSPLGTMTAYVSPHHQTVDIGILIGRRALWGGGLGQDAWKTLLNWLIKQNGIRKVTAGTMRCNTGMVKLMERSGMRLEAIRPAQELLDGVPQDMLYFGKFSE